MRALPEVRHFSLRVGGSAPDMSCKEFAMVALELGSQAAGGKRDAELGDSLVVSWEWSVI